MKETFCWAKADTAFSGYRPFAWTAEAHFSLGKNHVQLRFPEGDLGAFAPSGQRPGGKFQPAPRRSRTTTLASIWPRRPRSSGVPRCGAASCSSPGTAPGRRRIFQPSARPCCRISIGGTLRSECTTPTLSAQYAMDPRRLILSQIEGHVLGGSVTGDADVAQWLSAREPASTRQRKDNEPAERKRCGFALRTCPRRKLRPPWLRPRVPFRRSNPRVWLSGTVEARWKDSHPQHRSSLRGRCGAAGAVHRTRNFRLPGTPRAVYRFGPGELELAESDGLRLVPPRCMLPARFRPAPRSNSSVTTTNLGEWQPVFTAAGYAGQIPVTLKGHASFNGTATGKLSQIAIAGNLQSQDFETLIPATAHTPEKTGQLECPAGRHSTVALGVRGAQRHAEPRS